MRNPWIQKWQDKPSEKHLRCLFAFVPLVFVACTAIDLSTQAATSVSTLEPAPPPNFTRGLLARREAEPLYPLRARSLGIEGWVMLRFSVNEDGLVLGNTIETLEEQPGGYFERSAITAARRMTFENTRGQTIEDVRYVFRYELEEQGRLLVTPSTEEIQFRELIPTRYITPNYPEVAQELGIEGFVIVLFSVSEQGVVEDVVIEESEPPGTFNEEAIAAALRLRFEPRIVFDGPVRVDNVRYRFDWRLPDQ